MTHSASLRATGSAIPAAAWVASSGLCLRINSITDSSVSMSALGVDWVAATAAGSTGLRGGAAARWRVVEAGGGSAAVVTGATAAGFSLGLAGTVLGPALRAIGRGFGNGTLALAHASVVSPENPTASAKLVAITNASNSGMA